MRYSILDLAPVPEGTTTAEAIASSVALAQMADGLNYHRYWLAEHHNMVGIASAATSIMIGHIAGQTSRIRVGAGGVMLPNHSPLSIAEQFGTLATIHGDRIDLGLGRAPGGDGAVFRALRKSPEMSENFPHDVLELISYLDDAAPDAPVIVLLTAWQYSHHLAPSLAKHRGRGRPQEFFAGRVDAHNGVAPIGDEDGIQA